MYSNTCPAKSWSAFNVRFTDLGNPTYLAPGHTDTNQRPSYQCTTSFHIRLSSYTSSVELTPVPRFFCLFGHFDKIYGTDSVQDIVGYCFNTELTNHIHFTIW